MAQAIVTVLLIILLLAYAVFFAFWNQGAVTVMGFSLDPTGQSGWTSSVQLFVVPIVGMAVGAALMALIMSLPWAAMRRNLATMRERLSIEQARNKDLTAKLRAAGARLKKQAGGAVADEPAEGEASELPADA